MKFSTPVEIAKLLRRHDIYPTRQRIGIASVLFSRGEHLSAEDIFSLVNSDSSDASKATVYNTLSLFVQRGLIREVVADPARIFYDPNTTQHHHFYNTATGKLTDIPMEQVGISALPALPGGMCMEGIEVIVRVRPLDSTR